jgi:tetratricopeptide (TPR) repeat protein
MEVYADLPGGERRWLLKIEDWDFNWQGAYRFVEPLALPAGTTLHMRYLFDNSAENLANPSYPPRRVIGGNRSTDEMATLALQVVTASEEDKRRLYTLQVLHRLERNPDDAVAHYNLGVVFAQAGDLERAAHYYGRAISLDPTDPEFRFFLANVRYRQRRFDEALALYGETLRLDPDRVEAHLIRGWLLEQRGDHVAAAAEYRSALARAPEFEDARTALQRVEAK